MYSVSLKPKFSSHFSSSFSPVLRYWSRMAIDGEYRRFVCKLNKLVSRCCRTIAGPVFDRYASVAISAGCHEGPLTGCFTVHWRGVSGGGPGLVADSPACRVYAVESRFAGNEVKPSLRETVLAGLQAPRKRPCRYSELRRFGVLAQAPVGFDRLSGHGLRQPNRKCLARDPASSREKCRSDRRRRTGAQASRPAPGDSRWSRPGLRPPKDPAVPGRASRRISCRR